jgi:hypothetical protein
MGTPIALKLSTRFATSVHIQKVVAPNDEARRQKLRDAICAHLRFFPLAADTAEGVVACWLPEVGFEDAPDLIDQVLKEMVEQRLLAARALPDGKTLYRRGAGDPRAVLQ